LACEFGKKSSVSFLSRNGFSTKSMNPLRSTPYGSTTSSPAGHTARHADVSITLTPEMLKSRSSPEPLAG
jgi:hypothetical protein